MGALLRQLSSSSPDRPINKPVAEEYSVRKRKADEDCSTLRKLTVQDCTRLIIQITEDTPVTILLDALDECEESTRHQLLKALDEIINNGGDITRFVELRVSQLIRQRLLLDGRISPKFRRKIVSTLVEGAQGMFRWVEMSLETLQQIKFERDFKSALGSLPPKLSNLYDMILDQIYQTETHGRDIATKTFKWLLCAQRLLSVRELIAAIPIVYDDDVGFSSNSDAETVGTDGEISGSEKDVTSTNVFEPLPENDIIRLCRNLVIKDAEQDAFRFAHQSVREYLLKRSEYAPLEQHHFATDRCLDVYLAEEFPHHEASMMASQNEIWKSYAQLYWPVHYKY
ncbi:MAG: hypothetical protein Q9190_004010, partial [Brigantiaea leucoxantha]